MTRLVPPVAPARRKQPAASPPQARRARPLALEPLEEREVPALTIQFDYSFDTGGFFNDPTRRAVLQQAANDLAGHLTTPLAALAPGSGNTWSETFFNPSTGQQATVNNASVAANTIVIYAGARDLTGSEAGVGGNGGYDASGSSAWLNLLKTRGAGGFSLWGGSLAFDDAGTNWYFGSSAAGIAPDQVDFYSVATHELGHALGIGTSSQWFGLISGGTFHGANADAVYGGAVPVYGDSAHWADGVNVGGVRASMDPIMPTGTRVAFSALDYAALKDLGWSVSAATVASPPITPESTSPPPSPPTPPPVTLVPLGSPLLQVIVPPNAHGAGCSCAACRLLALSAGRGTVQIFTADPSGSLLPVGSPFQPFAGYTGTVRSVVADFNGDGIADFAFGTGGGTVARIRVINGATGTDLVSPVAVFGGFKGGVFLAAGDVNRDSAAELAVSEDAGGLPRVTLFKIAGGIAPLADFVAFNAPMFRGGVRIAMGDVNRDGSDDLIVGAGPGGGPVVEIYNGAYLAAGQPVPLVTPFFALSPTLRTGANVALGDINGDGYADVIYSTGTGGGPVVRIVSGAAITANPGQSPADMQPMALFFALPETDRGGIRLTARDLDADGRADLVVGSMNPSNPAVRVIPSYQIGAPATAIVDPFTSPTAPAAVYVG